MSEFAEETSPPIDERRGSWASRSGPTVVDDGRRLDLRALLAQGVAIDESDLLERFCDDQVGRWRAGQRVPAEAYLALHPMLQGESEAGFELVYGEFVLRESLGESPLPEEFLWRFPRFADRLRRQLDLHRALGAEDEPTRHGLGPESADVRTFAAPGPFLPGYQILGELGRGGMGVVYKARHERLNRNVALKVIHAGVQADPAAAARFRAEAEAAARFQHPNIIQVYEIGEWDGVGYLALEYAAGGSLQAKLAGTPQETRDAAELLETLARVIHYAHQRGIVHRDLKPANVVLTEEGVPKITDFGLAKLLEHEEGLTHTGAILGTPSYMAPEQVRGDSRQITAATDVYALGAILYEMLTGRPPFKGSTPISTMEQVSNQEPLPPGSFQRHVSRDLETICLKCLEKEPRRRYASALDLADDLRRFLDGRPISARPTSASQRTWKWARRNRSVATALVSVVLAVVLLLVGALYYNARLRVALRSADTSARTALEQRNLAFMALDELVNGVQQKLGESPATRPIRRSLLGTAITGLEKLARSAEASAPDLSRAIAHQKLGDIYRELGQAPDARRQYELSHWLTEHLAAASPRDLAIAECRYRVFLGLGELNLRGGHAGLALKDHQRAAELAETIAAARPRRVGARRGLVEAYLLLGRIYGFLKRYDEAEVWLVKSRDLALRWVADEPGETQARDLLASCYRKLADIQKLAGDPARAREEYGKAIETGRELVALEPGNTRYLMHLSIALHDLAGVAYHQHALSEARPLYQEAERRLLTLIAADDASLEPQLWLVKVQSDLGRLEADESNHAEAAESYQLALDRLLTLDREGRLEGWPEFKTQRLPVLKQGLAACEAALKRERDHPR